MPPIQYYWVIARPADTESQAVGPHTLYKIRFWVAEEILSSDVLLRKEGESTWIKAKDLPGFYDFPTQLRERLARSNHERREIIKVKGSDPGGPWWQRPAGNSQIEQLKFMRIPFDPQKITRYWADKLIREFAYIDSDLYEEYVHRPPTPEIIEELRSLGKTDVEGLDIDAARRVLSELQSEKEDEEREEEIILDYLNRLVNGDCREELGIRLLNKTDLRELRAYLDQNVKNWYDKIPLYVYPCRHLGKFIPEVFPHWILKAKRDSAVGRKAQQTGCLVLIGILLIAIVKFFLG
jgi:hypothetical protein